MPWSPDFVAEISRTTGPRGAPRYVVESIDGFDFDSPGGTLRLSSHDEGPYYARVLARAGSSYQGGSVTPGDWGVVASTMKLGLIATRDVTPQIVRGQLVVVRLGFRGWPLAAYQTIHCGHIQGISYARGQYVLEIRGIAATLSSRYTDVADSIDLFNDYPKGAVDLDADYTPGDPEVEVSSTAGAQRESGSVYMFRISPPSGTPFWLTATGTATSPTRYTGVSSTALFEGSAVAVTAGATLVDHGWCVRGLPAGIARKVIVSTGGGTNGAWDSLPASFGCAVPDSLVDQDDIDETNRIGVPDDSYYWHWYGLDPIQNPLSALQELLSPAGYFLTERQGALTVRCGVWNSELRQDFTVINDRDIVAMEGHDLYAPDSPSESAAFRVYDKDEGSTALSELVTSRPAISERFVTLPWVAYNKTDWRLFVANNIGPWYTRVPSALRLTLLGWRFAHIAPGSLAVVNHRGLRVRDDSPNPVWWVAECSPDYFGHTSSVTLYRLPDSASDY